MATVARKGEPSAGAVLIKVAVLDGTAYVLSQSIDMDGKTIWLKSTGKERVSDGEAEDYIKRSSNRDPDLWVVEIEDRAGRHFLTEPVEGERQPNPWPPGFQ